MYEIFENQVTQPSSLKYFIIPNPWALYFFSHPTIFSSAPTLVINNDRSLSSKEVSVHDEFLNDIKFNGKRYSVKLLFKETPSILPDNYNLSLNRLKGFIKHLKANLELFQKYNSVMKEQCQTDILEDADLSQPTTVGRVHYLPHHPVVRKDKSISHVHIMYDALPKATSDSPSLNDVLYPGPSLIPAIINILIRFCWHNIRLTSDIEMAF